MKLKLQQLLFGALLTAFFPVSLFSQMFAYVTNYYDNSVSVLDTSTNMVVATIGVGIGPWGIAITPDGSRAYVANFSSNDVSVVNTSGNTVVATIAVGPYPAGVAITPDGTRVYVTNWGDYAPSSLSVIDTSSNTVVATVAVGIYPRSVAITPDGRRAYLLCSGSPNLTVVDTASNSVVATVNLSAWELALAPDGTRAYLTGSPNLLVVDTTNNTVISMVDLGSDLYGVAINPAGTRAFVTHYQSNNLSVVDTASASVVSTVDVGSGAYEVAVTPDGTRAYVTHFYSNSVSVVDTLNNTLVAEVAIGNEPLGVAITPLVPFSAFSAKLDVYAATPTTPANFSLNAAFTLGAGSKGINPATQPVTLQVGTYEVTIPAGSFRANKKGVFTYSGTLGGVSLQAHIGPTRANAYRLQVTATGASIGTAANPVTVKLNIGANAGLTSATAVFH